MAVEKTWVHGIGPMEEVLQSCSDVLTMFRFLRSVLDVTDLELDIGSVTIDAKHQAENKRTVLTELANIVDRNPLWAARKHGLKPK